MSLTRAIAHNTIVQVVGKVLSTAIGLVVIAMLTRYLGEAAFGRYYTIMVYLQIFGVVVDLGLYIILVKKISEPNADTAFVASNIFTLRLVSAVIILGAAPLIALALPYPSEVRMGIAITTLAFFGITMTQVLTGLFQKHLKMNRVAIADVVGKLILLILTWWVVASAGTLLSVMETVVAGSLATAFMTFIFARRLINIRLAWDFSFWRKIFSETWPIAISIFFNMVYFKSDTIILSLTRSDAEVGVYGASNRVLEVIVSFPAMFAGLVLPLLAAAWSQMDKERFRAVLQKAYDFLLMLALPLIGATLVIAEPVMRIVTGEGYADAGELLRIVIIATGTIFIGNLFGNAVVAINRQRAMMWLYVLVAVISLAGYLIVIPIFSYFGAAWIRVASEVMITVAALTLVLRSTGTRLSLFTTGKIVCATALMTATLWVLRGLPLAAVIVVGFVEYALLLFAFRTVSKETILDIVKLRST